MDGARPDIQGVERLAVDVNKMEVSDTNDEEVEKLQPDVEELKDNVQLSFEERAEQNLQENRENQPNSEPQVKIPLPSKNSQLSFATIAAQRAIYLNQYKDSNIVDPQCCNKKVKKVQYRPSGASILAQPAEILLQILNHLDRPSLYSIRLASKRLNETVINILYEKPEHHKLYICSEDKKGRNSNTHFKEKLRQLTFLLEDSQSPEILLNCISIKDETLLSLPKCITFLEKFGKYIKTLEVDNASIQLSILHQFLTEWCPNIEEIIFTTAKVQEEINVRDQDRFYYFDAPTPLTLKRLTIVNTHLATKSHWIVPLLRSSPKFQFLKLGGEIHLMFAFFEDTRSQPEALAGIEELSVDIKYRTLYNLTALDFGKKLKSLTLEQEGRDFGQPLPNEEILKFLNKVGGSLEKLIIRRRTQYEEKIGIIDDDMGMKLPFMGKLKDFTHQANIYFPLPCIDFLKNMPQLNSLCIKGSHKRSLSSAQADLLFSDSTYLISHPQLNLKTLVISGTIEENETYQSINQMFPNLEHLSVTISMQDVKQDLKTSFVATWLKSFSAIEEISKIQKLKSLEISFCHSHENDSEYFVRCAFYYLKDHPNLKKLALTACYASTDPDERQPVKLCSNLLPLVTKFSKLRYLTLENFQMEMWKAQEFFKTLANHGIAADFLPRLNYDTFTFVDFD